LGGVGGDLGLWLRRGHGLSIGNEPRTRHGERWVIGIFKNRADVRGEGALADDLVADVRINR